MKSKLITLTLAASILGGIAGSVLAETSDYISPNDTRNWYDQMDRENRGGGGSG